MAVEQELDRLENNGQPSFKVNHYPLTKFNTIFSTLSEGKWFSIINFYSILFY